MAGEAPFSPNTTVSLSATTSSSRVALTFAEANQVTVTNLGPDLAYINFGDVTVTAVVATSFPVLPGSQVTLTTSAMAAYAAAICPTSTAVLKFSSGEGYVSGVGASSTGSSGGPSSNVAVTSVIPGTGATNLGKAEDAVHASGDTGVFALAVSTATPSAALNAAGDYSPFSTDISGVQFSRFAPVGVNALLTKQTVNITTATTTAVVTGTASQFVRVYKMVLNIAATQTLNIISSGGTSLVGAAGAYAANGQLILNFDSEPWFTTVSGEGLSFVTTTTGAVTGTVYYVKSA